MRYALIQTLHVELVKTANWFSLYCKHYNVVTVIIKIKNKKDIGNKNKSQKTQIFLWTLFILQFTEIKVKSSIFSHIRPTSRVKW